MNRRLRRAWAPLALGACTTSCITFSDSASPIVPTIQVYAPPAVHVGDTVNFYAGVTDQRGVALRATGVPLVSWSYPAASFDSVEINASGTQARLRPRTAGPVRLTVRTYVTANMPAESVTVSTHVRYPWSAISAGGSHTCARSYLNEVFCWGQGSSGAVGVARAQPVTAPAQVTLPTLQSGIWAVSAGSAHSCITQYVGSGNVYRVFCWGENGSGQLGDGSADTARNPLPAMVVSAPGVPLPAFMLSSGARHTCARGGEEVVYCWGAGEAGQLGSVGPMDSCGDTGYPCSRLARPVAGLPTVISISAGGNTTCVLVYVGEPYCWGDNTFGQAGAQDTTRTVQLPGRVDTTLLFEQIDVGATHACGVTRAMVAYCWGSNRYGELGVRDAPEVCGGVPCSRRPIAVAGGGIHFTHVQAGNGFTCALDAQKTVYCWGLNDEGQSGAWYKERCGDASCSPLPQAVEYSAITLSTGDAHACRVSSSYDVACWGRNESGQLGNGTLVVHTYATEVVEPAAP
jgi:alpha-tubulin suppressor-like RCC1 family protein